MRDDETARIEEGSHASRQSAIRLDFRWVLLWPLGFAIAYWIAQSQIRTEPARGYFFLSEVIIVKSLGFAGCLAAALQFRRGDYLKKAWVLLAINCFVLIPKDILFGSVRSHVKLLLFSPHVAEIGRAFILPVANLPLIVGTFMLARAWQVAGLTLPGTNFWRRAVLLMAILVAVVVSGPPIYQDLLAALSGQWDGVSMLSSELGGSLSFIMIAPVLLTAVALRGGRLAWPWAFITGCNLCWLFCYATNALAPKLRTGSFDQQAVVELLRGLAFNLTFAAGIAQRAAVRAPRVRPPLGLIA